LAVAQEKKKVIGHQEISGRTVQQDEQDGLGFSAEFLVL
jgi:hypothetical protein